MGSNKIESVSNTPEPWIAFIDDEIEEYKEEYPPLSELNKIVKELLLSQSDTAAVDAARDLDTNFSTKYLTADPLVRFKDDKGMEGYLWTLYQLIFDMGRLISFKDGKQAKLVKLILELRSLPPKTFKIWNAECEVYTKEPLFGAVMDECWNANGPSDSDSAGGDAESKEFIETCEEWVNFSALIARCIQAGLLDRHPDGPSKYPSWDVDDGLEKDLQPGILKDCRVMVSAQYIILAGRRLYEAFLSKSASPTEQSEWWQEKWQLWSGKFEALSGEYEKEGKAEMAAMAREAHDLMLSLSTAACT